jgi:hypothetical protein
MLFIALLAILEINDPQVTLSCTASIEFCRKSPATPWDLPSCDEYDFNTALLESAARGDRSAVELLRQRYATTFTYAERFRIGGALLGRDRDDSAIWNELLPHAENAVNFAAHKEKLDAYCAEHGYDSSAYEEMSLGALAAMMTDRRARPLLLRALASGADELTSIGVLGLAMQSDETALPQIDTALQQFPGNAIYLACFKSAAADRVAAKYMRDEADRVDYERARSEPK